jgi:hypothetical protein
MGIVNNTYNNHQSLEQVRKDRQQLLDILKDSCIHKTNVLPLVLIRDEFPDTHIMFFIISSNQY